MTTFILHFRLYFNKAYKMNAKFILQKSKMNETINSNDWVRIPSHHQVKPQKGSTSMPQVLQKMTKINIPTRAPMGKILIKLVFLNFT